MTKRDRLIHNERTKLKATLFGNVGSLILGAGWITPAVSIYISVISGDKISDRKQLAFTVVIAGATLLWFVFRTIAVRELGGLLADE